MAIQGRTPEEALREFRRVLGELLNRTITHARVGIFLRPAPSGEATGAAALGFLARGRPAYAELATRFGQLFLGIAQNCETYPVKGGRHEVRTAEYAYVLTRPGDDEPMLRWEYKRRWPDEEARWCRHHLQGEVDVRGLGISLNEGVHLPTGYVPIEDVVRFCIVDLGVHPLSEDWHEELERKYSEFRDGTVPR